MSASSSAKHKPGSFLGSLLGLVAFSAVAGLLVSAALTPAIAVASTTANSTIDVFENMPDYVTIDQQSELNRIYGLQDGQYVQIAEMYAQNREIVDFNGAGQWAPLAVVAGEDRRFYEHGGVDGPSVIRAALGQLGLSSSDSGASTLTMQLVRQQLVEQACGLTDPSDDTSIRDPQLCTDQFSDSYSRKLQEMKFAIGLESRYSKNEILLAYLNIANFGNATYGIQAAAQRVFGINARDLSIAQAASIMAIVKNPNQLNLFLPENYQRNQERRDFMIRMMFSEGFITEAQRDEALAIPVDENYVNIQPPRNGCISGHDSARFFCDYVEDILQDGMEMRAGEPNQYLLGDTAEANASVLALGGLDVYTTIDVDLNDSVQAVVDTYVPNTETRYESGGAVTMLDVQTGNVLTMAQNRDFNNTDDADPLTETGINYNVDYEQGGSTGFQPGSGFKIFTLAAWIQAGFSPNASLDTRREPRGVPTCGEIVTADPQNNEGLTRNRSTVQQVFNLSMNTGIMEMATRLDVCDIMSTAEAMGTTNAGVTTPDPITGEPMTYELQRFPSGLIGGGSSVSPMGMAEAFQTIANGGQHCLPRAIDRIVGRDGADIPVPGAQCEAVLTPEVASVMQLVLTQVTRANPLNNPGTGNPYITKTGTNEGVVQTWVNGASSTVATSVWNGNSRGQVSLQAMGSWDNRSRIFTQVTQAANLQYPGGAFLTPDAATLQGNSVALPNVAGMSVDEATNTLTTAGFAVVNGGDVDGAQAEGMVEYTSPAAGVELLPDSSVTIFVSNGANAQPEEGEVPDLSGMSPADAAAAMSAAGLEGEVQVTWGQAPEPDRCTVLTQNPAAGETIAGDAPVAILVGAQQDGVDPGC